jgi:acetyl-CoA synthetase
MIPEAVVAMLACARLGAPHSVVFGGFSAEALRTIASRDAQAKVVITADGGWRRGAIPVPLKAASTRRSTTATPTVEQVLVVRRTGQDIDWTTAATCGGTRRRPASPSHAAPAFDSEHPLFILYTSGTTGKPKGILHTTGGYLTQAPTPRTPSSTCKAETDVYWCTADIGWVTGHSYIVYGPLANGATQVLYEGTPEHPAPGRFWEIIERTA